MFQRLVDDNFAELADCILVTAKGMPDMATRAFVHALLQAVPRLTAVACALASKGFNTVQSQTYTRHQACMHGIPAVVDWNPSGAAILAVYKYGSQRMHEAARYALPTLRWLGARGALLHGVPNLALQVKSYGHFGSCGPLFLFGFPLECFGSYSSSSVCSTSHGMQCSWLLCLHSMAC